MNGLVKHCFESLLGQCRALKVFDGANVPSTLGAFCICDGGLSLFSEPRQSLTVVTQVELGADEDDGRIGGVVRDFGVPLSFDVLERRGRHEREADKKHAGLGV